MPIYEYNCLKCNIRFEYFLRSSSDSAVCPCCNGNNLRRLVSNFAFSSKDNHGNTTSSSSGCSGCHSSNCSTCSH